MAEYLIQDSTLENIADAIRAKTGGTGTLSPAEMATAISNIPSGSSGIPKSGVVFIDYDGTVVEVWDSSDVASKTALPANPTGHTRLVAEGWNWTLADIKSYMASYPNAIMTVGQMYHTVSGKTELDITLTKVTGKTVTCNISGEKDWGDGTINTSSSHTYTNYGDYTIKCSGTTISSNIFGVTQDSVNRYWCTAAYIASGVTSAGNSMFFYCFSLTSVTIPNSVTSIDRDALESCRSLTSVTIPSSVTSIGSWAFANSYSITSVSIPNSVTSISTEGFYNCYSLTSVTIPNSVTSIGDSAFKSCYSIIKYDFSSATAVPTLVNTNALQYINGNCKIVVPDTLYDSWKAATNWSTYANYIYKASEVTD